ncbi:MAG: DUF5658 family protein [Candidatus Aenigmarchaeota archaeon]|nr:DUF5658 family protein [Candidatus Aenigmarchaeota archaeon]
MYVFILLGILVLLNYIDAYLTLKTFSKKGYRIEENPILRYLLRDDVRKFLLFKVFDIFVLSLIIYWMNMRDDDFALILLGVCILLYSYINYKNYIITVKVGG